MTETDLQLGGGYVYQWECAILLALNYFFEPLRYNPTLFDLVNNFLGRVEEMHLEGEDRETGVDLEDSNLVAGERRVLVQVKTKQAEGKFWTPTDPLLLKALYRFYDSRFFTERPGDTRFVFLTNRPFNPALVRVKEAIQAGALDGCAEADKLCRHLARYAKKEKKAPVDPERFQQMLVRTAMVEYLGVDEVKANVQKSLQALGRQDWQQAYNSLFAHFARQSTRHGGGAVTRASIVEVLGPPPEATPPASTTTIDAGGGAYIAGNLIVSGDFVGRDRVGAHRNAPLRRAVPPARPTLPATDDPLALVTAALQARRFLLVLARVPFPPAERPPANPARTISQWQMEARTLPALVLPLAGLPPCAVLSLDPSERVERAFHKAGVPLNVARTRRDVVTLGRHNLLKLGGDLETRAGLLLSWADVRDAASDPDKAHLLREVRSIAREGVVLVAGSSPARAFARIWEMLIAPHVREAEHCFALGPADFAWPTPLTRLEVRLEDILAAFEDEQEYDDA